MTTAVADPKPTAVGPVPSDPLLKEREKEQAAAWLAALPVSVRRERREGWSGERLVMYRMSASSPEFWEKTWIVSPPFRMRGYKLPAWYATIFHKWLPRDGLIVEAGCGNGNLLRMCANEGYTMEGLDFAAAAIEQNRKTDPAGRYVVGDVRALPYGDGEIAGYLSMGVVEHFSEEDRRVILRDAARALRPGGVAVITVPSYSAARRIGAMAGGFGRKGSKLKAQSSNEHGEPEQSLEFYQFFFTLSEIRRDIEEAGLRVVGIDGYDCRKGWIDTFGCGRALSWLERRGRWLARLIDQPPRPVRRFCPHMLMLICRKEL